MERLAPRYPGYGWEHNCGYPTIDHRKVLRELGVTPFHRQDFGTVKIMLLGEQLEVEVATAWRDRSRIDGDGAAARRYSPPVMTTGQRAQVTLRPFADRDYD